MTEHSAPPPRRRIRGHNDGSLYRRASDGMWIGATSGPGGRRQWVYAKKRADAKTKLDALRRLLGEGLEPSPSLTLGAFLQRWLASVEGRVRHSTFRSYRQTVLGPRRGAGAGLIPALGHIRLARLSVPDVEAYLAMQVASGAQGHTPARHRAVLSGALADAMRWSLVGRNVASLARLPSTDAARVASSLTLEQARRLIDGTRDDRLHALWLLALFSGMREAELLGLAWDDLDLDAGRLKVEMQLVRQDGRWVRVPPKTKAGSRSIALAPDVVEALREHQRRMALERQPDWAFFGLVFVTTGGQPLYGWQVLHQLYAHEERLGLPRVPVHDLRHTGASLMLEAGLSLEDVKATLGHSSIRVTSDVYSHRQESQRQHVGDVMQRVLGAG
ncbi:MAG TPA: site-specific integrase [Candidatus Saccharimonadales bacterium]|nr:site-specific integrase [Candidatus Saccharimonadales bacterium]